MKRWTLLLLLSLLGCTGDENDARGTKADSGTSNQHDAGAAGDRVRLRPDGRFFRDGLGRAVILRGLNARVAGVFDVTFDDGRMPVEDVPSFGAEDCRRMAELGFSFVRLPINWSGIEPQQDQFDETYLARVDAVIACLKAEGIYALVDLHQDAYSKEIGEDGAPLWAIVPPPTMLLEGPLSEGELTGRRLSGQVLSAFRSFFEAGDPHGLQAQYIEMLQHVARRYAAEPFVLGLDLFNEPVTDVATLAAFNARAAAAVKDVAPELTIMFEPTALWSRVGGEAVKGGPFAVEGSVYAPHLYAIAIEGTDEQRMNAKREDLLPGFETAQREADAWRATFLIGEFGPGPSTRNYETLLKLHYDLQDEFMVSSALWLWKESAQGSWGLFDATGAGWTERPAMVNAVSRPHAMRVAGTPTQVRFEGMGLAVDYDDGLVAPNLLFVPERFRVESASCDGAAITPEKTSGVIELPCGGPGSHALRLALKSANQI